MSPPLPEPTRAAGLARLEAFAPLAADYEERRNHVLPGHPLVSRLSPWLRHRLVLEHEAVARVLREFPDPRVDKFVQEIGWRTYWKGWLQQRPGVWADYLAAVPRERDALGAEGRSRLEAAEAGATGIECFDAWARELAGTGYLHNHARMWFASIWIFTLDLPWALGADLFLRRLLDGDPASNTLSWRWVAGLHTRGRHYLARAANIERYTEGRFTPHGQLREHAAPLPGDRLHEPRPLPDPPPPDPALRTGLLLHGDDLAAEVSGLARLRPVSVAAGYDLGMAGRYGFEQAVRAFTRGALADGLARAAAHFGVEARTLDEADWAASVLDWAGARHLEQVVTAEAPVGPWAEALDALEPRLAAAGVRLVRHRRAWDARLWPHATRGYFQFRKRMYGELETLLAARPAAPPGDNG